MYYPNFNEEKKLWKQGYNFVAGLDESGRGPLAGPVVAASVCFDFSKLKTFDLKSKIKDSKELSEKQRENFYDILTRRSGVKYGVGIVSEKVIDKINILAATKLAMQNALEDIYVRHGIAPDFLLIDGNFKINSQIQQKSIISGDKKVFSCSAAGIIAKVTRDRIMMKMHKKYPNYGFDRHKGYGTKLHLKQLKMAGPSKIHRRSFYPVSTIDKNDFI